MKKSLVLVSLLAACVVPADDTVQTVQALQATCPDGVPGAIAPRADQDLSLVTDATGVQKYTCSAAGAWVFVAPEADVYRDGHYLMHHYAGPTWEHKDGSSVVGARAAGTTVDPTAIPWLLLNVVGHGPIAGRLDTITQIQRVTTSGGNAPAGACAPGATVDVPYTTAYLFYRTKTDHPETNTRCGAL